MSSFEEEWAQRKREASGDSGMTLTRAGENDDGSEGGSGGLKSSKAAWTTAGNSVGLLKGDIAKARTALEQGQQGQGSGGGVESAVAQREVYMSWKRYLGNVSGRCGALVERLAKAGHDEYKNDQATRDAFDRLDDKHKDTPAVGGQRRGR